MSFWALQSGEELQNFSSAAANQKWEMESELAGTMLFGYGGWSRIFTRAEDTTGGNGEFCSFRRCKHGKVVPRETDQIKIRIDGPHISGKGAKYPHLHIMDKAGNSLDNKLNIVPHNSPQAHIEIKGNMGMKNKLRYYAEI